MSEDVFGEGILVEPEIRACDGDVWAELERG